MMSQFDAKMGNYYGRDPKPKSKLLYSENDVMIRLPQLLLGISLFFSLNNAFCTNLIDIYQGALDNDPTFRKAYSTFMSNREAIPQAISVLKPQLNASGQLSKNYQDVITGNIISRHHFDSTQWSLNATQAIFNAQAWAQVKKAKAAVISAQATFNDAAQDLMIRTANAYFAVLLSHDTLAFAQAKKQANNRQLEQATQRFDVGLDTITSVYEAKAAFDQSIAEVIAAQNDKLNKEEQLRKLTNRTYQYFSPLRNGQIPLIHPKPNRVQDWVDTGVRQNYKLAAARFAMQASRANIKVQSGAGLPTVSLVGNASQVNNSVDITSFFAPQHTTNASIGAQLNFPIYQGGLISANTRQAQYDFLTASDVLEVVYRDVVVNSRIAFNTITDGISKVKADRQRVISQRNSLESTQAQFEVGTRTMVDVTNAQQRLFDAQRQLASDQYGLISAILALKYLAGTLNVRDLEEVNSWLGNQRATKKIHHKKNTQTTSVVKVQAKKPAPTDPLEKIKLAFRAVTQQFAPHREQLKPLG